MIYTAWQHGHCSKKDRWKEGGEEGGEGGEGGEEGEEGGHWELLRDRKKQRDRQREGERGRQAIKEKGRLALWGSKGKMGKMRHGMKVLRKAKLQKKGKKRSSL